MSGSDSSCAIIEKPRNRPRFIDLEGQRFGKWLVIGYVGQRSSSPLSAWLCRCDCGTEKAIPGVSLRRGDSKSCGCSAREFMSQSARKRVGPARPKKHRKPLTYLRTPPPDEIKKEFSYDQETGEFLKLVNRGAGRQRGTGQPGRYRVVAFSGRSYQAHRLAWWWIHGEYPAADIDHINGDPSDNRLCNLRVATRKQNTRNKHTTRNRLGFIGVYTTGRGYKGKVFADGKVHYTKMFSTPEEAARARDELAREIHGEFAGQNFAQYTQGVP